MAEELLFVESESYFSLRRFLCPNREEKKIIECRALCRVNGFLAFTPLFLFSFA